MATTLTASIDINAQGIAVKNGRSTTGYMKKNKQFANGTSVDQADKAYYGYHTIAASGSPENLDFAGGGLIDLNGDTITWVEMVGLIVHAPSTNTVNVLVGAHAAQFDFGIGTTATMQVRPGETKVLINISANPGYAITATSADGLKFAIASGTDQVLEILAIGRSA